jgi:hypothetical protein
MLRLTHCYQVIIIFKVAGDPRYKVLIVQKSDTRLHGRLLGDEKKKKKF